MKTYQVTTQMHINRNSKVTIVEAKDERAAKYSVKKMHRTADGLYPKVTEVKEI